MSFAKGPSLFDDGPALREFENFLRTNISDEKTLEDALRFLMLVFARQRSVQVGLRATIQYLIDRGELRRDTHPRDEICLVPDPSAEKLYPNPYEA